MLQLYFLSILANIVGGLALSSGYLEERLSGVTGLKEFFAGKPGLRVSIGVVAVVAGILKLLSVTKGDVPVVGDLVPALTGLIVGVALLVERFKEKSSVPVESQSGILAVVDRLVLRNRNMIGIASAVVGGLHFLIPGVLFL